MAQGFTKIGDHQLMVTYTISAHVPGAPTVIENEEYELDNTIVSYDRLCAIVGKEKADAALNGIYR